jgi:pimeloyl-ACP methyl ester carboxylesterase
VSSGAAIEPPTSTKIMAEPAMGSSDTALGSALEWHSCEEPELSGGECATLTVPLDYSDADGATVDLFVYRIASRTERVGVLFMNPGGPGVSGVSALVDWRDALPAEFDLVTFDPRGVGRSEPVSCIEGEDLDRLYAGLLGERSDAERQEALDASTDIAAACAATKVGPFIGTVNVARDLDRLRAALGEEQLTYVGFSYGTVLGWTYAGLFPARVRAMVLDGPVDPTASNTENDRAQAQAVGAVFGNFVEWCRTTADAACPDDSSTAVSDLLRRADETPLPTAAGSPPLGTFYAVNGILSGLFTRQSWPDLGRALTATMDGDGLALAQLSHRWMARAEGNLSGEGAQDLIYCADHSERTALADLDARATLIDDAAPPFAPWLRTAIPRCAGHPAAVEPVPAPTSSPVTVLVVAATGDIATPYAGAQRLVDALGPNAVLLTRDGDGHGSYGFNQCISELVERYLQTLTPPRVGTRCADEPS